MSFDMNTRENIKKCRQRRNGRQVIFAVFKDATTRVSVLPSGSSRCLNIIFFIYLGHERNEQDMNYLVWLDETQLQKSELQGRANGSLLNICHLKQRDNSKRLGTLRQRGKSSRAENNSSPTRLLKCFLNRSKL